jgi:hypothetical protein
VNHGEVRAAFILRRRYVRSPTRICSCSAETCKTFKRTVPISPPLPSNLDQFCPIIGLPTGKADVVSPLCHPMIMRSVDGTDADGSPLDRLNNSYSHVVCRLGARVMGRGKPFRIAVSSAIRSTSLAVSLGAFLTPFAWKVSGRSLFLVSYLLSVAWLVLLIAALLRRQDRMMWMFFGLPFAAYWPGLGTLLYAACRWGHDCI